MVSIIIPHRNCPYLSNTVDSILKNATGDIEVIVHVDEIHPQRSEDPRVSYIYADKPKGMRAGINIGLEKAKGEYIMKCDDHCVFDKGFDKIITDNMEDDWLVIPRRYSLHADNWDRDLRMPIKDYHYLSFPQKYAHYGYCMFPQEWKERTYARMNPKYDIDDTMTFQGSCWFAKKDYFMNKVGFLNDSLSAYSPFSGEPLEIGLKYWLGGGKIKVNKKTWYAHLFKNKHYYDNRRQDRDYKKEMKTKAGYDWAGKHWMRNEEPNMIHPISWLVEKFWPVPTWPEDRNLWTI